MPELSAVEHNLEHLHEWVKDEDVAIHYRGRPIAVLLSDERYKEIKTDILRNCLQIGVVQFERGQSVEYDFVVISAYEYHMLDQENVHAKLRVVVDEMLFGEPESFSINELMAEIGEGYPCSLSISELEQLRELLNEYDIRCVGSGEYTGYTVKQVLDMIKNKRQ